MLPDGVSTITTTLTVQAAKDVSYGWLVYKDVVTVPGEVTCNGVTSIGPSSFAWSKITIVIIPEGVTTISDVSALIDYLLSGESPIAADVNNDYQVTIGDVTRLIDLLLLEEGGRH